MANTSINSISLKAMVDKASNQIIFVESDNDFIDVIFSFLTIPMGKIIRLTPNQSIRLGVGCLNNVYASVKNMDLKHFRTEACKDMLLSPRSAAESQCKNLKVKIYNDEATQYFMCSLNIANCKFSYCKDLNCDSCGVKINMEKNLLVTPDGGVFVKGLSRLIITDDLQVIPPLTAASLPLLTKLGVMDVNTMEEVTINVGVDEVLNLLMRSLASKTPLTESLLKNKPRRKFCNEYQGINTEPQMVKDKTNLEGTISVKLIVSKSKKMVCYAEAGEDFVNLLLSFLTIPLGFIVKHMGNRSLQGCIDQLYKSVQDLDDQYMMSSYHKEMLLTPKLVPGFCYENHLLGTEEATYYYAGSTGFLSTDRVLLATQTALAPKSISPFAPSAFGRQESAQTSIRPIAFRDPKANHHQHKNAQVQGFLEGPAMFTVTDDLNIRPVSLIYGLSLLNELKVPLTDIYVQTVQVHEEEALRLLVAAFLGDSALTITFIRESEQDKRLNQEQ
ncbi:hypothetical protein RchiOBHm_Chr5g0067521 [Rosa chinensis]|uniref:DUF674 family protein n=1 Tax=Rosa chinensis TaxID=74649 RepID=A0A2P6QJG3_ROSCH|nr:uncharacterized protein LOC112167000 [Rosa chinensis]XP_024159704.1 uncharacterized protein LOC112167000 [Rosa chinensis]PRQ34321.1 hypothetical protein RchiOBHm_Chr5g0067521 [Rosa chinensis]